MISRIDQEMNFSQTALDLRAYRQELLASNIANADTPNYKARDINFNTSLAAALGESGAGALMLAQTAPGHLKATGANRYGAAVKYRREYQASVDGNTVNMDVERAAFAENALQMEALITFVRAQFKDLTAAVSP
ncbi:flagellar basal body rod protein FlgB [mine drainage metagenome]|uniref:Flagellar basal body rod protein FlgB n=1 Tax=mine drainage metagenome TaxID=410659 RepID=A0A1J5SAS7_9ZZZZ